MYASCATLSASSAVNPITGITDCCARAASGHATQNTEEFPPLRARGLDSGRRILTAQTSTWKGPKSASIGGSRGPRLLKLGSGLYQRLGDWTSQAGVVDRPTNRLTDRRSAARPPGRGLEITDGRYRAAVIHQLAEYGAEKKIGKIGPEKVPRRSRASQTSTPNPLVARGLLSRPTSRRSSQVAPSLFTCWSRSQPERRRMRVRLPVPAS